MRGLRNRLPRGERERDRSSPGRAGRTRRVPGPFPSALPSGVKPFETPWKTNVTPSSRRTQWLSTDWQLRLQFLEPIQYHDDAGRSFLLGGRNIFDHQETRAIA